MKKVLVLSLFLIILAGIITFGYFYSVWSDEQKLRDTMIQKAYRNVPALEKIEDIDFFTGDKSYYFIFGKDEKEKDLLIWLNEDEVKYIYLVDWVTEEEIEKMAKTKAPETTIERINAGIDKNNRLIYEVLYKEKDGRLGYQFYSLLDGEFISMYLLGKVRD